MKHFKNNIKKLQHYFCTTFFNVSSRMQYDRENTRGHRKKVLLLKVGEKTITRGELDTYFTNALRFTGELSMLEEQYGKDFLNNSEIKDQLS